MQVTYKEVSEKRRFGVELEVSPTRPKSWIGNRLKAFEAIRGSKRPVKVTPTLKGWAETKANDYWHVKYDSTCGPIGKGYDHGWEIASFVGQGHKDLEDIAEAAGFLGKELQTNNNCGLHVHVDVSDFTQEDMGLLLLNWMRIEEHLFNVCAVRRSNNHYCRALWGRMTDKMMEQPFTSFYSPLGFWRFMQPQNFNTHNNDEKKHSLNTLGFAIGQIVETHRRKTVELRLPECKLDKQHVLGWTTLFLNFVDSAHRLKTRYPICSALDLEEILIYLGLKNSTSFYLLGPRLLWTKKWFLKKYMQSRNTSNECWSFLKNEASNHLEFISRI